MATGIHMILRERAKANAKRRHATTIAWNSDMSANPNKCVTPAARSLTEAPEHTRRRVRTS